jgi:hypothetical protein
MHDIDSTRLEANPDQNENLEDQEQASDAGEAEGDFEMPMSEEEEEALAAELLGVSSEEEMDQFFGKLFRKLRPVIGGAAKFLSQNAGPLTASLKGIARKALPFVGGALGTAIPIPGVGTALGGAVGRAASNLLEMETNEMEVDEREFEIAKRFVRLASHAVRQGARMRAARFNARNASNLALRYSLQRLRRSGGFRWRPIYRPCPPCPVCAQPLTADDLAGHVTEPTAGGSLPSGAPATGGDEFEFEDAGVFEDAGEFEDRGELEDSGELEEGHELEGENYENDHETFAAPASGGGRSGRWVRRGRKIVLYGL